MNAEAYVAALKTRRIGRTLHFHETTESTNSDLRALAQQGAPYGTVVVARAQTAGRGRRGHRWHSPPDAGLYASFLVLGPSPLERVPLYTLLTALAAHEALRAVSGIDVGIRWPNDLLCRQTLRKLGGILVESSADEAGLRHAVIGVGLNLLASPWPPPLDRYATSIEEMGGRKVPAELAFGALASALEDGLDALETRAGISAMLEDYQRHALGLGEEVEIVDDLGRGLRGRFAGLGADGALLLEAETGRRAIYAGSLRLEGAPLQPEW